MRTRSESGFSYIQVLAALAIVAILARLAYPSYMESVRKGKRAEGRAALHALLQQEELHYSRTNSYIRFSSASTDGEEKKFKWFSGTSPARSAYEIKAEPCEDETIQNCVILIAQPGTEMVDRHFRDPLCGKLTLSSTGEKTADAPDCWP
ncbi:MAG TPA: type IV pilin protein [Noviherbaspirillum sp.]|uniref:type IV pilin protein n=1 Tax=Noviherbaspirillum sp. TaxID=1926288 RepID=UPI002D63A535|nr:type IV pilin protein [Noviherbaspirillum sp.]HYD97190.1 type IV pilin protein [Noviherbaspirillum sp.]